jgi:hypothetical protein
VLAKQPNSSDEQFCFCPSIRSKSRQPKVATKSCQQMLTSTASAR